MRAFLRLAVFLGFAAMPALALARPPLIYHRVANLVAHPGGSVRLALSSDDVVVRVKPGASSVTVTSEIWANAGSDSAKKTIIRRLAPHVTAKGKDVLVKSPEHHGWSLHFGWGSSPQALVTVQMPPSMAVHYRLGSGDFHFDNPDAPTAIDGISGSGDVRVDSSSSRVLVKSGSGDLVVNLHGAAGQVRLGTGSGDIDFTGSARSLKFAAGSGDIQIHRASTQSASITTGSGDIVAHWSKVEAGGALHASAGSGDLVMYLPRDTVVGGHISTGSGDVNSGFPVTVRGSHHFYTLTGGSGAVTVDMNTGSGDVTLHKGS